MIIDCGIQRQLIAFGKEDAFKQKLLMMEQTLEKVKDLFDHLEVMLLIVRHRREQRGETVYEN